MFFLLSLFSLGTILLLLSILTGKALRAEIIIKDNAQMLDVLEKVKEMDGVNDTWYMLDMTKIENKSLKLDKERFDLIEKIQNAIKDFSNELSKE
jgi:signal transduction histidine kinase